MTVGSRILDGMKYNSTGQYLMGRYFRKDWSGADYPASKVKYTVIDRRGKIWRREKWVRDVKRARREEHDYNGIGFTTQVTVPLRTTDFPYTVYGYQNGFQNISFRKTDSGWNASDDYALLGKLQTAVSGSEFNLGIFLGEGHQALRMIGDNATAIARSIALAKRGKFSAAITGLTKYRREYARKYGRGSFLNKRVDVVGARKTTSSNWLELQYGWLPLLSDMKSGAEFVAHQLQPAVFRVSATRVIGGRSFDDWIDYDFSNNTTYGFHGKFTLLRKLTAILREDSTRVAQLSGITDVASVAWELLPWSFVIDWAYPIGKYLQARGIASALKDSTFVRTTYERWRVTGPAYAKGSWRVHIVDNARDMTQNGFRVTRNVFTSGYPIPLPSVRPLNKIASWMHAANGLALLSSLK